MAVNSDNVTAKLRKLSKGDLIWCILEFEKRSFGCPSLGDIIERWAKNQPSRIRFFAIRRWLKEMPRKEDFYAAD